MAEDPAHTAPTLFLLMAQYNGQTVVPLEQVCRDFFGHLTVEKLLRKALRGDIALPIVRIETSQKAQRGRPSRRSCCLYRQAPGCSTKGMPPVDRHNVGTTAVRPAARDGFKLQRNRLGKIGRSHYQKAQINDSNRPTG